MLAWRRASVVGKCGGSSRVLRNTCTTLGVRLLSGFGVGPGELQVPLRRCTCATFERLTTKLAGVSRILLSAVLSPLLFTRLIVKAMRRKIFVFRSSHYGIYS